MAATFADAETAIISRWQANWTQTPTAYENVTFDPLNLNQADLSAGFANGCESGWVQLRITQLPGMGQISTPGSASGVNRRFRCPGIVGVAVNVPAGRGKALLMGLADAAADIWRAANFSTPLGNTLLFFNPVPGAAGPAPQDEAWFQQWVLTRFWFDYDD